MRVQPKVIEAKRILDEHARNPAVASPCVPCGGGDSPAGDGCGAERSAQGQG